MEYVKLDVINRDVSRIGLGTWALGGWLWGGTVQNDPLNTIEHAVSLGINLIDTAPVYGFGLSEELVGKALKNSGKREDIILATKAGLGWKSGIIYRDSSRKGILGEIDKSLERLNTDYIDIYQIHWPDKNNPIEETAEVLNYLFESGKIRAIGVSNFNIEQMQRFQTEAPIHTLQPPYNMFERNIAHEIIPFCKENDIKILAYSPLCRGLLTGRITNETKFEGDDNRLNDPLFQKDTIDKYLRIISRLDKYATDKFERRIIHMAVRWVLDSGAEFALWGARRPDQLDDITGAMGWKLGADDLDFIKTIIDEEEI